MCGYHPCGSPLSTDRTSETTTPTSSVVVSGMSWCDDDGCQINTPSPDTPTVETCVFLPCGSGSSTDRTTETTTTPITETTTQVTFEEFLQTVEAASADGLITEDEIAHISNVSVDVLEDGGMNIDQVEKLYFTDGKLDADELNVMVGLTTASAGTIETMETIDPEEIVFNYWDPKGFIGKQIFAGGFLGRFKNIFPNVGMYYKNPETGVWAVGLPGTANPGSRTLVRRIPVYGASLSSDPNLSWDEVVIYNVVNNLSVVGPFIPLVGPVITAVGMGTDFVDPETKKRAIQETKDTYLRNVTGFGNGGYDMYGGGLGMLTAPDDVREAIESLPEDWRDCHYCRP